MKKLLIWSRVPYYNHCPYRFCYHRAKKYHPSRCPLSTLYLRQNLICPPASCLYLKELFISKGTVEHTSNCEFLLKIYHFPSFWKSLSSTKRTNTPTLSAIDTLTIADRGQGSLNADVSGNTLPFVSQPINNMGLINKGWYGMFIACGIWCLADVSSVSPSSEQTGVL